MEDYFVTIPKSEYQTLMVRSIELDIIRAGLQEINDNLRKFYEPKQKEGDTLPVQGELF